MIIDVSSLYRRYSKDVYRFSLFLSGNRALAEDITSETFLRAWTVRETVRLATVKAFLFTIARNLFLQSQRKQLHLAELDERIPDPRPGPGEQAAQAMALAAVIAKLNQFPEPDRVAVLMQADGVPYEDIARVLGIGVAAAKVKVHRARRRLASVCSESMLAGQR
jgi:RNA polymerase sigma-70 factor, ECF subfamily